MRAARLAALGLLAAAIGCTTPLELGERRYREGDRLGALEIWRGVGSDSLYYPAVQRRIADVENEFEQLVVRYKKRARYYERKERLAESVLNYRLALKLQPDDHETLSHVQVLVRELDARKRTAQQRFDANFAAGELAQARGHLEQLRTLDPFDPVLEAHDRRLDDALRTQVEALLGEGKSGLAAGHLASAEQSFRAVLELEPENGAAQGYLAYVERIREPTLGGSPGVPPSEREIRADGFYRNAIASERRGQPYAAIRHDLRALRINPQHDGARRHLSRLRRELAPEVDSLIETGRVHYEQEELQSALDSWRRALLIDPANGQARDYVARAERLLQNLEQLRAEPDARVGVR